MSNATAMAMTLTTATVTTTSHDMRAIFSLRSRDTVIDFAMRIDRRQKFFLHYVNSLELLRGSLVIAA